ncbi:hypothetical protein VTO42DRAFT_4790 [Malbranchea cinnamomea]
MWKRSDRSHKDPTFMRQDVYSGYGAQSERVVTTEESMPHLSPQSDIPPQPRVASSIYSKRDTFVDGPSYGSLLDHYQVAPRESQYTDVSPPISPIHGPHVVADDSPDVSPIDESPGLFDRVPRVVEQSEHTLPVQKKSIQGIPTGRPTGATQETLQAQNRFASIPSHLARQGNFVGEPASGERGIVALASAERSHIPTKSSLPKPQFKLKLSNPARKLLEIRRHHNIDDPASAPPPREPWKGPSGRSVTIDPIQERRTQRVQPPMMSTPPVAKEKSGLQMTSNLTSSTGRKPVLPSGPGPASSDETITPPVPPKDDVRSVSAGSVTNQLTVSRTDVMPSRSKPLPDRPSTTYDSPEEQEPSPESELPVRIQNLVLDQQPTSRFSMTTYATTEAGSPPETPNINKDVPPLPGKLGKITSRKPTPSEVPSDAKDLPHSPEVKHVTSRIEALKAKQNDLARRRGNINTIIHELTQVIQPSSISYDMATRSEVKKTVESLNNELAEIKKEEHEIGMKLLRAYKKLENEDYFGETSPLWVKRVVS